MSEIYKKNVESFLSRYPEYTERFKSVSLESLFAKFETKSEAGVLQLFQGEVLLDTSDSRFFEKISFSCEHARRVCLLEGFGLGTLFQHLLRNKPEELKDVFIVEADEELFLMALALTDFGNFFEKEEYHWFIGLEADDFFSQAMALNQKRPRCQYMQAWFPICHPLLRRRSSAYYDRIDDEFKASQLQILRGGGFREDSILGLSNVIENTSLIESNPGIKNLTNLFKDCPAVVVASGPSLKRSLPYLKTLQDKAVIISADASAKVLLDNGIQPHFILSLERVSDGLPFYSRLNADSEKIKSQLLVYPLVPKEVIEAFPGKKWVCYRNHGFFYLLERQLSRGVLSSSSSVAHFCVRLADHMGCPLICLVGQDLSYDPQTLQSHVDGIAMEDWSKPKTKDELNRYLKETEQGQIILLPGNFTEKVPSNPTYFSMLKEYSWEVLQIKSRVVNSTLGGAKIPGIEWADLEGISQEWISKSDLFSRINEARIGDYEGSIEWSAFEKSLSDFSNRLLQLRDQTNSLTVTAGLKASDYETMIQLLRHSIVVLLEDQIFASFIAEMMGYRLYELENEWSLLRDGPVDFDKKLKSLSSWFNEAYDTALLVSEVFSRFSNRLAASTNS